MNLHFIAYVASNHPLASGLGDFVKQPDFSSWSSFGPTLKNLVGAVSALVVILSVVFGLFYTLVFMTSGGSVERHDKAVRGLKHCGIGFVLGLLIVSLILKAVPLIQSFSK